MGAGHGHRLHYHGHSVVHRAPAHVKLVLLVSFMLVVVATPREWYLAFAGYLLVLLAVLVPFIAEGPRIEVLGMSVSQPGLVAAWGLIVKGSLGVLASLTLA